MNTKIVTAESVTSGHPDKLCDLISDAILDECLKQDSNARVACEVLASKGFVVIAGEITTTAKVNYELIAKNVIEEVGYDAQGLEFKICINEQSPDISTSVTTAYEKREELSNEELNFQGAGDQGIMYGYATNENEYYLPTSSVLASLLTQKLTEVRITGKVLDLLPDGKSQVSIKYENDEVQYATSVILSTQHEEQVNIETLRKELFEKVIKPVLGGLINEQTQILINPSGRFVLGGIDADTGLTGRKIIVDTYGGVGRHGGGAFSGKDASKVDRSGAYMARYVAKNLVASGVCSKCEVSISYAIGKANPTSVNIETFNTAKVDEQKIKQAVLKLFDLRPKAIINRLELTKPVFKATASGGHFGKTSFAWEKLDMVKGIKEQLKI